MHFLKLFTKCSKVYILLINIQVIDLQYGNAALAHPFNFENSAHSGKVILMNLGCA